MEIVSLFKEPIFYIFTVIGSLLLSVVGNLVTPFFQNKMSLFYNGRNQRRIRTLLAKRDAIHKLHISYDDRGEVKIDAVLGFLRAIGLMLIGIASFVIGNISFTPLNFTLYISGFICLYFGFKIFDEQNFQLNRLQTATEREKALLLWMDLNKISPLEKVKQNEFLSNWDAEKFDIPVESLLEHIKINQ
jgi:hypothetical protein